MSTNFAEKIAKVSSYRADEANRRAVDRPSKGGSACSRPATPLPMSDDGFPPSRPRRGCPDC
jgi:hypothetical protein